MDLVSEHTTTGRQPVSEVAGRYLTFFLGEEQYGVEILKVQEIIGVTRITPVPNSPTYIKGVINLRGKIIPVIDLRTKFGLTEKAFDDRTCFIVMNVSLGDDTALLGVIVDTVSEVTLFPEERIEPTPDFGEKTDSSFIVGMGKRDDSGKDVVILIDLERALSAKDISIDIPSNVESQE